ncbi:MAG: hypothetical protein HWD58_00100 [Bacteroidota bacterium]|nr:MAG: hypothetical protein HWD58_00100 [Bacteroidota bacterium]
MNNLLTSRHFQWWILFAGILLYVPSLWSGFISDDHKILALGLNHVQDKQFFRPGYFGLIKRCLIPATGVIIWCN